MESGVKQRIKLFIEHKGISIREFERSCGLSNGYVGGIKQTIMPNKLSDISQQYPDLNLAWLLTGEGEMLKEKNGISDKHQVTIVPQKSQDKLQDRVPIYNVEARMSLVSLYDVGRVEAIGDVSFPNMPKSDAAVIARGDSMYPLIKSGSVVAFRRLHNFDFFVPGEIYIVNFSVNGDNYNVFKYVQTIAGDNEKIRLVSYNPNHGDMVIQKSDVLFMGLVTFWVNISAT